MLPSIAMRFEAIILAAALAGGGVVAANSASSAPGQSATVRLEYIAHAAFVIVSPGGTRIAVDPFNSNIWLGYSFPAGNEADAVLVTHPHYDHDASYYFPRAPVFRSPGSFVVDDVRIQGFTG